MIFAAPTRVLASYVESARRIRDPLSNSFAKSSRVAGCGGAASSFGNGEIICPFSSTFLGSIPNSARNESNKEFIVW